MKLDDVPGLPDSIARDFDNQLRFFCVERAWVYYDDDDGWEWTTDENETSGDHTCIVEISLTKV